MAKRDKLARGVGKANPNKKLIINDKPPSLYDLRPAWTFHKCDFTHEKWGLDSNAEHMPEFLRRLKSLEGQSWGHILGDTSGRKHNPKNHSMDFDLLAKEAQARAKELNLHEFDEIYSITVTGRRRFWGILSKIDGKFHVVWYDPEHEIYPVDKSHT